MEQNPKPISIVVTSYYREELTEKCLLSIKENTTYPHSVTVIDNGSDMETQDTLWDLKEMGLIDTLILLPENKGLEPAKNLALNFVESELYVDTDNDVVAHKYEDKCWLTRLVELMDKYPDYVAISSTPQIFIGAIKSEMFKDAGEVVGRDFVGGSLRIMRTAEVKAVGGWRSSPKDMVEANRGEEHYICGKLRQAGWKVGYARDVECKHLFGSNPDEPWGYPKGVPHYHRPISSIPTD